MRDDLSDSGHASAHMLPAKLHHGRGPVVALIILALILAIGFFYMTRDSAQDQQADKITHAAESVDRAAKAVGDAALNSAENLEKRE